MTCSLDIKSTDQANNDKENLINHNTRDIPGEPEGKKKKPNAQGMASILPTIESVVKSVEENILLAWKNASKNLLVQAWENYRNLNYAENEWESIAQKRYVKKWNSQKSWKEALGGVLFFPASQIHLCQESLCTERLLQRSDILYGCFLSASFQNPLALFYAVHISWDMNQLHEDTNSRNFLKKGRGKIYADMLKKARSELGEQPDCPDVCYALGQGYFSSSFLSDTSMPYGAMDMYELGASKGDLKNKCALLVEKTKCFGETPPTIEDFLELAKSGYSPAYIQAAEYAREKKDRKREKEILDDAATSYPLAHIHLAMWHQDHHQQDDYRKQLAFAAEKGIAWAFVLQGINLVGDCRFLLSCNELGRLRQVSQEEILKACMYFQQAINLHDLRGAEYLSGLLINLDVVAQKMHQQYCLDCKLYDVLMRGCALGSDLSWVRLREYFPGKKGYDAAVTEYAFSPWDAINLLKNFMDKSVDKSL